MSSHPAPYEHHMTVRVLRLKRLFVWLPMAIILFSIGYTMVPMGTFLTLPESEVSFFLHSFGHLLMAGGLWIVANESVRSFLARGNGGEWHIRLSQERFLWQAPRQPYGQETSFDLSLGDIERCEYRRDGENGQLRSYWVYPQDGAPIRLKDTSGVNIPKIFELLVERGIPYREVEP